MGRLLIEECATTFCFKLSVCICLFALVSEEVPSICSQSCFFCLFIPLIRAMYGTVHRLRGETDKVGKGVGWNLDHLLVTRERGAELGHAGVDCT